tara:strand:- start:84 stop:356 length:273 start_codon:yes stop_codon:yes gene_type:complete
MATDEFGKALARIQRDSFVEKQIQHSANYLPKRLKEVLEESEKMDWKHQNIYEAACFKNLLETAIEQIIAVDKNLEERRDEANQSHTKRN